jgi:hypothetical protein
MMGFLEAIFGGKNGKAKEKKPEPTYEEIVKGYPTAATLLVKKVPAGKDFSVDSLVITHEECLGGKVAKEISSNPCIESVFQCQRCKLELEINFDDDELLKLCLLAANGGELIVLFERGQVPYSRREKAIFKTK